jgi:hypothetical protein
VFRPLLDLDGFKEQSNFKGIVLRHAKEGLNLMDRYRSFHGCRFQSMSQMFCMLHLCDVVMRFCNEQESVDVVRFGLQVLSESRQSFPVAALLQFLFHREAVECKIQLPSDVDELVNQSWQLTTTPFSLDEALDACSRPSYTQPVVEILAKLSSSFVEEWVVEWERGGYGNVGIGRRGSTNQMQSERDTQMQIRSILNG